MDTPQIDIQALGQLARLDFLPAEGQRYAEQLPKVVEYVGHLESVVTQTAAEVPSVQSMRTDQAGPSPARDQILAAAPEREGDYWKVKAVF